MHGNWWVVPEKEASVEVSKAIARYMRHHRAEGSTAKTLKWHEVSLGQFAAFIAEEASNIEELSADGLRAFIAHLQDRKLAQSSVATKVRSVKAWGRWLVAEEYVSRDPFARVRQPHVDDTPKPTFTPEEIDRLLLACRGETTRTGMRDFAMLVLMFSTGLRASEVINLCVEDIDWDKGVIVIRRGKGGKMRVVPLGRQVEKVLQKYLDSPRRKPKPGVCSAFITYYGEAFTYDTMYQAMKARGVAAGVEVNPHKFRHSCAIQYLRNGGRIETLRTLLGHTSLTMTLHYARIAAVDLTTAHETCDPVRSLRVRL